MIHRSLRPWLLLACLLWLSPAALPQSGSVTALKVRDVLTACESATPGQIWKLSDRLVDLGNRASGTLREAVSPASTPGKLCLLRALVELDNQTFAAEHLVKLANSASESLEHRKMALELVALTEEPDASLDLMDLLSDPNPELKLAAARAVYRLEGDGRTKAKRTLRAFLHSSNRELRAAGAIALAEIGDFRTPGVTSTLQELAQEPGLRGQLAAALHKNLRNERVVESLHVQLDRQKIRGSSQWAHLDEIRKKLREVYVDKDSITDDKLRAAAAHGMLKIKDDPHSAFMDPEEHRIWNEGLDPSYGGIGALIDTNVKDDFRIARPFFGGPAWKADIRSGDSIVSVDGVPTAGRTNADIIKQIKGPPGTQVVLTIYRAGWGQTKDVTVIRAKILLPTVLSRMLPGKVGYIEIANYGESTGREFRDQLKDLEAEDMRGLVIDLRWNPGGSLETVKECLTPFLPQRTLVAEVRGRTVGRQRHYTDAPDRKREYPISVLINGRSASGAELMSGVLQHYSKSAERSTAREGQRTVDVVVLGEPSFGKGTVQYKLQLDSWKGEPFSDTRRKNGRHDRNEPFTDLNSNTRWDPGEPFTDRARLNRRWDDAEPWVDQDGNGKRDEGEKFTDENKDGIWNPAEPFVDENNNRLYDYGAAMKVTVARYYLPSGKNFVRKRVEKDGRFVYEGGVVPDVRLEQPRLADSHFAELRELQQKGEFRRYVEDRWEASREDFRKLAFSDDRDPSRYPGFDEYYEKLDTRLTKQEVRRAIRIELRRRVANMIGMEITGDASDDYILRKGIANVLDRLGVDPATIAEYKFFSQPKPE